MILRTVIIGAGRVSPNHLAAIKSMPDKLTLAGLCDIEPGRAEQALKQAQITASVPLFTCYREMMEEIKPDLAAVATDSGSHAEIGMYCLQNGAHCIIEKPITLNMRDADDLTTAAEINNKTLAVCHQNRFNKSIQKIKEAFDAGRFGGLSHVAAHVRWCRDEAYYNQAPWRGKWRTDGGCLMNQCIHNADLLRWLLGEIEEVTAYTRNAQHPYIEAEDLGLALIKAKDGVLGLFEGTVNAYGKNLEETLYIFGGKGMVKAAGTSVNVIEEWRFADGQDDPEAVKTQCREHPPNVYGFGHTPFYADVADAIHTGRRPLIDGNEGKSALELILAMYKSKKTGLPVRLPLEAFAATDMEGIFCSS